MSEINNDDLIVKIKEIVESKKSLIEYLEKVQENVESGLIPTSYLPTITNIIDSIYESKDQLKRLSFLGKNYIVDYGQIGDRELKTREIRRMLNVYYKQKLNRVQIGYEIAKMYQGLGDWTSTKSMLYDTMKEDAWENASNQEKSRIYRELGVTYEKLYKTTRERKLGIEYLKKAISLDSKNVNVYSSLAGAIKNWDHKGAYKYYKKALKIDKTNSYPLCNYIILKLKFENMAEIDKKWIPNLETALEIRKAQCENFLDVPWSFFDVGTINYLLGATEEAINYFLMAIRLSTHVWQIKTTLDTLKIIEHVSDKMEGYIEIMKILHLGILANLKKSTIFNPQLEIDIRNYLISNYGLKNNSFNFVPNTLIIAGNKNSTDEKVLKFINNLKESFDKYKGIVICSNLKGEKSAIDYITVIKDLPSNLPCYIYIPLGQKAFFTNLGFSKTLISDDYDFSRTEVYQYWFDILTSNVSPKEIKLIGFSGGELSYFEYRIAIALGAHVGLIRQSGGYTSKMENDLIWENIIRNKEENLNLKRFRLYKFLENTSEDIMDFIKSKFYTDIDNEAIRSITILNKDTLSLYHKEISQVITQQEVLQVIYELFSDKSKKIGVNQAEIIEWKDAILRFHRILNDEVLVFFFLNKISDYMGDGLEGKRSSISKTLEEKIQLFLNYCNKVPYNQELLTAARSSTPLQTNRIDEIIKRIFGSEVIN